MNTLRHIPGKQSGLSIIEVLVSLVILMVGLLGLAGLQMQSLRSEMESYQRVQALILTRDMVGRINANRANAADYAVVVANDIGTAADGWLGDPCTDGTYTNQERDFCQWSNALRGAGEAASGVGSVGAMIGARGCITYDAAAELIDITTGAALPGTGPYIVSVAWQGLGMTFAPVGNACGEGQYGNETQRRVVSTSLRIGNLF